MQTLNMNDINEVSGGLMYSLCVGLYSLGGAVLGGLAGGVIGGLTGAAVGIGLGGEAGNIVGMIECPR